MEKTDIELIKQHRNKDHHLAKLWEDHLELEREIETLEKNQGTLISTNELHALKRKKLAGRDQIELILKKYR